MQFTRKSRAASVVAALSLAGAGLLAVAPTATAANSVADPANIVSNSNFATPVPASEFNTYGVGSTAITGWTVSAGTVDLNTPAAWESPAGDPSATQTIDLNGTSPGALTQTLATQAGLHYSGSFELAANPGGCIPLLDPKTGTLSVGSDSQPFSFDGTGHSSSDMGWTQVSFAFVASSASTPITFASTISGSCGPVITDVVVDPPLPPTIATNANVQVLQTAPAGTKVTFASPAASDPNTGSALTSTCAPASGTIFPAGTTTVTCSVTEPEGLSATSKFTVKVEPVVGSCEARALGFDGTKHVSIDQSNPATSPCAAKSGTLLAASSTLSPGILGIGSVTANGSVLKSSTSTTLGATSATTGASDQIASFSFVAPGITVKTTTIKSEASSTLNASCVGTSTGSSDIEGLVINGKHYTIGSAPLTIPLGLGLELNLNQQIVTGNVVTQRALSITSTHQTVYHTVIGETVAGLSCG
ncbi:MAG TPA: choice-of-anchor P family protein [Marmoricola sp.]|jgi:choice-of-anchor C domain-containing protein|nr:choice-of-anchor P family protein [Marmoricola sp.]